MMRWMRSGLGESAASMGSALGALEEIVNPAARRAREDLEQANERVIPAPSPGDRLFTEGRIVIRLSPPPEPDA